VYVFFNDKTQTPVIIFLKVTQISLYSSGPKLTAPIILSRWSRASDYLMKHCNITSIKLRTARFV
jgi:hypothetical protein